MYETGFRTHILRVLRCVNNRVLMTSTSIDAGERKTGKPSATEQRLKSVLKQRERDLPIWVRAPTRGVEHFSGLSRPYLYDLALKGLIVSRSVTQPGKIRGCRLFHLPSILKFIEDSNSEVSR